MEAPRALRKTENGEICEVDDPRARFIFCGQGTPLSAEDAKQVAAYLEAYTAAHASEVTVTEPVEAKAVAQTEVEDKAVSGPMEEKTPPPPPPNPADDPGHPPTGVDFPPEVRRQSGGGRRGA